MEPIERLPIYFVISERVYITPFAGQYGNLRFIKQVIQCDVSEVNDIYARIIDPMYQEGLNISCEMYLREPPSPFRTWKEIELQQRKDAEERDRQDRIAYLERTARLDDKPGALPGD